MIALVPNSILNTLLAGRVWYIFHNFELNISNTQPELKKSIAYKKKRVSHRMFIESLTRYTFIFITNSFIRNWTLQGRKFKKLLGLHPNC